MNVVLTERKTGIGMLKNGGETKDAKNVEGYINNKGENNGL